MEPKLEFNISIIDRFIPQVRLITRSMDYFLLNAIKLITKEQYLYSDIFKNEGVTERTVQMCCNYAIIKLHKIIDNL